MAVRYYVWDGEEFSRAWFWIIRRAVALGIIKVTDINDGHRSMALQAERVRQFGVWDAVTNPTGAARPSPTAPHIREGREDHALDVQTGAILRLAAWLESNGVATHRPIATEPWHLEAQSQAALIRFGRACEEVERAPHFTAIERRLMRRRVTRATRLALKLRARAIQRAARRTRRRGGGWDRHDRARRFQALRARALR